MDDETQAVIDTIVTGMRKKTVMANALGTDMQDPGVVAARWRNLLEQYPPTKNADGTWDWAAVLSAHATASGLSVKDLVAGTSFEDTLRKRGA